jgi:hypothetical protein
MGEQHFWMGNAGMGNIGSYNEHYYAQTGFVSEYGSLSLPTLESLKKELSPQDLWSEQNNSLPRWSNLPINISAYSYLSSFDYDGIASLLNRVDQYVDRHIKSIRELVDDSQLYQAFLLKYATDAYRRKKYEPINGTRIWDYGEVWPGVRWGIIDYFRVPKMSYYCVKNAQARFAVNFAYEEALESQVSGKRLQIPAWVINDYPRAVPVVLHNRILDLEGREVWSRDFNAVVPADGKQMMGVIDWVTPDAPGVYVLRGEAVSEGGELRTTSSTFIKVTPRLFAKPIRVLLIGQRKYNFSIAQMIRGMGVSVDVIDERSLSEFERLRDGDELRKDYDVVWLAPFDSLWKLLDAAESEGLLKAIRLGTGFIHSGGRASFHGGFGEGACLDLTPLADALPAELESRYDLVFAQPSAPTELFSNFPPIKDIHRNTEADPDWSDGGLAEFGVIGFNDTRLKAGSQEIMTIHGRPLWVVGSYGQGRTVAFTGFTPAYAERQAVWDAKVICPYLIDQDFYVNPASKAYFYVYMELLSAATGLKPQAPYAAILAAHEKPLFETLKELPTAELKVPMEVQGEASHDRAYLTVELRNGDRYARLIRLREEWEGDDRHIPYLVTYSDNYFDLLPGESEKVDLKIWLAREAPASISGGLIVEGSNVSAARIAVKVQTKARPH